jgi:hypothetical protein
VLKITVDVGMLRCWDVEMLGCWDDAECTSRIERYLPTAQLSVVIKQEVYTDRRGVVTVLRDASAQRQFRRVKIVRGVGAVRESTRKGQR